MLAIVEKTQTPDYDAIKTKQNAAWASGDYAKVGVTLQIAGEQLAEALNLAPDARVLDVAAGNGNATLAFAHHACNVTSTDYVDTLLDQGRARAEAEGLDIDFQVADAENLPFEDGSFDAVVSTFGVMFAPNQLEAASELTRVCRSGGKIGLANWTPDSFIGHLFRVIGLHVAPPAGVQSPALWGSSGWLEQNFAPHAKSISQTRRNFCFRYRTPEYFVEFFREFYGPVHKAFLALPEAEQEKLHKDILDTVELFNTATDGSMRVPSEYVEVVITKS